LAELAEREKKLSEDLAKMDQWFVYRILLLYWIRLIKFLHMLDGLIISFD
jgi:hypothetical protein